MIRPAVLVFDVNETILDIRPLEPFFTRLFGRPEAMRMWYAQLILHTQAVTLAGRYAPLTALSAGTLRMMGEIHGRPVAEADIAQLAAQLSSLPPHADVAPAFQRLRAAGFRLATLTNSPPSPMGSPLDRAGLGPLLERQFSVDAVGAFKPAPATYAQVTAAFGLPGDRVCLVAAHAWDTLGAKAAGWAAALVLRPGIANFAADGVPQPDLVVADLHALADRLASAQT